MGQYFQQFVLTTHTIHGHIPDGDAAQPLGQGILTFQANRLWIIVAPQPRTVVPAKVRHLGHDVPVVGVAIADQWLDLTVIRLLGCLLYTSDAADDTSEV